MESTRKIKKGQIEDFTSDSTILFLNEKENLNNKSTTIVGNESSNILYPSIKAIVDWVTSLFVPKTRNLTINGTTQDLSVDRTFTIPIISAILSGLNASSGTFTSSNTILEAFGKIKYLIDNITSIIVSAFGYTPADDSTVVHKSGDETIGGIKTFSTGTLFNSNLSIRDNPNGAYGSLDFANDYFTIEHENDNPIRFKNQSSFTANLLFNSFSANRNFEYPDVDGMVLTTGGTMAGQPITGNLELGFDSIGYTPKRIFSTDDTETKFIEFNPDFTSLIIGSENTAVPSSSYARAIFGNGTFEITKYSDGNTLSLSSSVDGLAINDSTPTSHGIRGSQDYTANITDLDYTQKIYVDLNKLTEYTVSTLPVGVLGQTAYVNDAVSPTYLGALTGGGSVYCPVFFNGSIWVSH